MTVYSLYTPEREGVSATVAVRDVESGPKRTVAATLKLDPPDAANDAAWFTATAWQGDGFVVNRLERVREGVYRTTEPIPVHDDWKAMFRLHYDNVVDAIPLYLPRDEAIPAPEVPVRASYTSEFRPDSVILQREQKASSGLLTALAYAVVAGIALSLLALLAWGLHRLAATAAGAGSAPTGTTPSRATGPARPAVAAR
jgi:hypothetical protein